MSDRDTVRYVRCRGRLLPLRAEGGFSPGSWLQVHFPSRFTRVRCTEY